MMHNLNTNKSTSKQMTPKTERICKAQRKRKLLRAECRQQQSALISNIFLNYHFFFFFRLLRLFAFAKSNPQIFALIESAGSPFNKVFFKKGKQVDNDVDSYAPCAAPQAFLSVNTRHAQQPLVLSNG